MEKKLKINFILKGIAVFAFVAFCLLAILAGVTLPFVSNASTVDSAVVSAENDFATASANNDIDYDLFSIPISQCNGTDTYYGFYITETFYNYISNFDFSGDYDSGFLCFQVAPARLYTVNSFTNSDNVVVKYFGYTYGFDNNVHYILTTDFTYSESDKVFIDPNGFTFLADDTGSIFSGLFAGVPDQFKMYLRVFNRLPYKEITNTEYITNYGFESRFGFIGSLVTSNLYVSLQNNALIPESLCRIRDNQSNELVNGWYITDNNELFLPILDSFDEFGNKLTTPFTGWHLTNISVNGVSSSNYNVYFEVLGQRISRVGVATIVNNVIDIGAGATPVYYVESNITNTENLLVYGIQNLPLKYNLKVNLSANDFYKFFAFFDYRTYTITNNDFYLSGVTTASKGYYDTGYNKGYDVGKDEGYKTGFSAGDSQGFARGVESANSYSFLGLFGAIFDAPIKAIFGGTSTLPAGTTITDSNGNTITLKSTTTVNRAGLLNFNIMGVNLSGFVLALFSLSILVVVIKFALARR